MTSEPSPSRTVAPSLPSRHPAVRAVERAMAATPVAWRGGLAVVAASGGADSTFLVLAACALRRRFGHEVAVAHVDHGWRGDASRDDASAVARLAQAIGVPIHATSLRHSPTGSGREGMEAIARAARYAFLGAVATATGACAVLVAHTSDDQAETILLSMLRGRSVAGLAGMAPVAPIPMNALARGAPLVRPMLGITARTVRDALAENAVRWREDASNTDRRHARNRLRLDVMPALDAISPGFRAALARSAGDVAAARDLLGSAIDVAVGRWRRDGDAWSIERATWLDDPPPVRRGALREVAVSAGADPLGVESAHLAAVEAMAIANRGGAARRVGHVSVSLRSGRLVVMHAAK